MKASEYKEYKGIRKESLRDNMSDIEIILTDLGEVATRELAKKYNPYGLEENKKIAIMGGNTAKIAKDDLKNKLNLKRIKILAQDGPSDYLRSIINKMDDKTFSIYLDYHLKTCERKELLGASSHVMDILKK